MTRPLETQRRRKWAPKVRTGCLTCKIRRKKCDEAKPHCLRCQRDKYSCDGYDEPKTLEISRYSGRDINLFQSSSTHFEQADTAQYHQVPWSKDQNLSTHNGFDLLGDMNTYYTPRITTEPSNPWGGDLEQHYTQYFLLTVTPLFSTTRSWRDFWSQIVPQAASQYESIRHAMIALAVAYNANLSAPSRTELLIQKANLSIREFSSQAASSDVALILCRLFTCISQCTQDWDGAAMHLKSGRRIIKEITSSGNSQSDIAKLMAPILLGASSNASEEDEIAERLSRDKRQSFTSLTVIRSEYGKLLRFLHQTCWSTIDSYTDTILMISWSTITHAINSLAFPDLVSFADDEYIIPAAQVRLDLIEGGELWSLHRLTTQSLSLFDEIYSYFKMFGGASTTLSEKWKSCLRLCVDNYVVQAALIEPRMTAGTAWHMADPSHCTVSDHFKQSQTSSSSPISEQLSEPNEEGDLANEGRGYYLEHVCPYRSGFTLAFVSE